MATEKSIKIRDLEKEEGQDKIQQMIESLVFNDYAEDEVIVNKNITVTFRTLTTDQTMEIKEKISKLISANPDITRDIVDSNNVIMQLAYAIQDINGKPLGITTEDKIAGMKKKPALIVDLLWSKYRDFVQAINEMMDGQNIVKKS